MDFETGVVDEARLDGLAQAYAREVDTLVRDPGLLAEFSRKASLRAKEYSAAQQAASRRNYAKYFSR